MVWFLLLWLMKRGTRVSTSLMLVHDLGLIMEGTRVLQIAHDLGLIMGGARVPAILY